MAVPSQVIGAGAAIAQWAVVKIFDYAGAALEKEGQKRDNAKLAKIGELMQSDLRQIKKMFGKQARAKLKSAVEHLTTAMTLLDEEHKDRKVEDALNQRNDENLDKFNDFLDMIKQTDNGSNVLDGWSSKAQRKLFHSEVKSSYDCAIDALGLCHNDLVAHMNALKITLFCEFCRFPEIWPNLWLRKLDEFLKRKDVQEKWNKTAGGFRWSEEHIKNKDDKIMQGKKGELFDFFCSVRYMLKKVGAKPPDDIMIHPQSEKSASDAELFTALSEGNEARLKNLLTTGTNANATDEIGRTALAYATEISAKPSLVRYLIGCDADVNKEGLNGPPLFWAARYNNIEAANLLLDSGAKADYVYSGGCAIHAAASSGAVGMITALGKKGCNMNTYNETGDPPLVCAIKTGKEEAVRTILEHGGNPNSYDQRNTHIPFRVADHGGYPAIMRILVESPKFDVSLNTLDDYCPLQSAAKFDDIELIEKLISKGDKVSSLDRCIDTPLHIAARYGNEEAVKRMLLEIPLEDALALKGGRGETLLHAAASGKNTNLINLLIDRGFKVDARDSCNATPLHIAARCGRTDSVATMLDQLADSEALTLIDNKGYTLLHEAAAYGNAATIKLLISKGFKVDHMDHSGSTPVHLAALHFNPDALEELIAHGADLQIVDREGNSALHKVLMRVNSHESEVGMIIKMIRLMAANNVNINLANSAGLTPLDVAEKTLLRLSHIFYGMIYPYLTHPFSGIVKELIILGADTNRVDEGGDTILQLCIRENSLELIKVMIKKGADVNAKSPNGKTPLHTAAVQKYHDSDIFEELIANGANVNEVDEQGDNVLHCLCSNPAWGVRSYQLLIDKNVTVNQRNQKGCVPLHYAAQKNDYPVVRLLIDNGADLHALDIDGNTVLHYAVMSYFDDAKMIINLLVDSGICIDSRNKVQETPLHCALGKYGGSLVAIEALIARGADIEAVDDEGYTILHRGCLHRSSPRSVKLLIDKGVNINRRSKRGCAPLHHAAQKGNYDIVKLLIEHGVNVNERDNEDCVPLHQAAERGSYDIVKLLIDRGASLHAVDSMGNNALHYAVKCKSFNDRDKAEWIEIIRLLTAKGIEINSVNSEGATPLRLSAGNTDVVEGLILLGADAKAAGEVKPCDEATDLLGFFIKTACQLYREGADFQLKICHGTTPLHLVPLQSRHGIVDALTANETDINEVDIEGNNVLHYFCKCSCFELKSLELLIAKSINVNQRGKEGCVPLHHAAKHCHYDIVKRLVDDGANVCALDTNGNTVLHYAAMSSHYRVASIVELLCGHGIGVDSRNNSNSTPLHKAVKYSKMSVIEALIGRGANLEAVDNEGHDALYYAKDTNIAEFLSHEQDRAKSQKELSQNVHAEH